MNLVKRQFKSSRGADVYAAVIDTDTGATSCPCPGWRFKRPNKPRECKHTKLLMSEFGFQTNGGVLPKEAAQAAKLDPTVTFALPKSKTGVSVNPEAFASAQAAVQHAVSMVRGKRKFDFDDEPDEPVKQVPTVQVPTKVDAASLAGSPVKAEPAKPALTAADVASVLNGAQPPKVKPMLAQAMKEGQTIADFTNDQWVLEEKIDGHRLLLVVEQGKVTGWTRPGQDRPAAVRPLPTHIKAEAGCLPVGTYDGELYVPGGTSSDVVRLDLQDKLKLVLFDVIEALGVNAMDKEFRNRRELLELVVQHCPGVAIHISPQQPVSLAAVQAIWDAKREGAILKRLNSLYQSGARTDAWVKVKKVSAAELTITGFEAGKNGPYSAIALKHDDGRTTTVKTLTNELLAAIEKNPQSYIGRRVTISYMGLTTSGQWRHPILDHFCDEKEA